MLVIQDDYGLLPLRYKSFANTIILHFKVILSIYEKSPMDFFGIQFLLPRFIGYNKIQLEVLLKYQSKFP